MKLSSRSILSPGRAGYSRDPPPPVAFSTSLSRRLSNSRSIKGGASPAMFPVTGKKRGCGFDNPEPSSPKVTCIGQVRVKSKKKHAKNIRSLSRRRKLERSRSQSQHVTCLQTGNSNSNSNSNNQRWVHIPLTICDALRTFGSEVSCLFPCRSSCSSTGNEEKMEEERKHGSCSAVAARWLVALQDGDANAGGGQREIELVKVEEDEDEVMDVGNPRRHVFDNLEIVNDVILGSKDEARVSVCVPPKNALLLMRCRSDPVRMEALTNRFWEPDLEINEEKDEDEESGEKVMVMDEIDDQEHEQDREENNLEIEMKQSVQEENEQHQEQSMNINEDDSFFIGNLFEENAAEEQETDEEEDFDMEDAQEELFEDEAFEATETGESNIEKVKQFKEGDVIQEETYEDFVAGESNIDNVKQFEGEIEEMLTEFTERSEVLEETYEEVEAGESDVEKVKQFEEETEIGESNIDNVKHFEEEIEKMLTECKEGSEIPGETHEELFEDEDVQETETGESNTEKVKQSEGEDVQEIETGESNIGKGKQSEEEFKEMLTEFTEETEVENGENEGRAKIEALPECLLLMMYEPKLSMEVSKETWVRRSDFTRRHSTKKKPPPPPATAESIDDNVSRTAMVQYELVSQQPARSSCSFPAPRSMIAMLEEKLVNTMGFESLALTRCKSEPMRTTLETCSWQNQLEPPRRASFGVGMAGGLGFCQFGS